MRGGGKQVGSGRFEEWGACCMHLQDMSWMDKRVAMYVARIPGKAEGDADCWILGDDGRDDNRQQHLSLLLLSPQHTTYTASNTYPRQIQNLEMDYSNILATTQDSGWSSSQESVRHRRILPTPSLCCDVPRICSEPLSVGQPAES